MERKKKRIRTRKITILEMVAPVGKRLVDFFFLVGRRFLEAGFLVRVLVIGQGRDRSLVTTQYVGAQIFENHPFLQRIPAFYHG